MQEIDYISCREDTDALRIWEKYKPTKQDHNYLPLYHRHLGEHRHQIRNVLEIGVQTPRSVRFWKEYFPNAQIVGLDIDPACKAFEEDRISIKIGDQGDNAFLSTLPGPFDVIIDDGSHFPAHQCNCFAYLVQHKLRERGVYVVEDCEKRPETINFFANLVACVNYYPEQLGGESWQGLNDLHQYITEYHVLNTLGISFYRYIIFIDKGRNPEEGEASHRLRKGCVPEKWP